MRAHVAEECKNDYAAQLQKFNKEQNQFYFSDMPLIFNVRKWRRTEKFALRTQLVSQKSDSFKTAVGENEGVFTQSRTKKEKVKFSFCDYDRND